MQKPVFAPLFVLADTTYILNFIDSRINKYDKEKREMGNVEIKFHKADHWKPQIVIDHKKNQVYAIYRKGGLTSIGKINLQNGNLEDLVEISYFAFIENIQIHDGSLYFLYKEKINGEYKKIYKMKI